MIDLRLSLLSPLVLSLAFPFPSLRAQEPGGRHVVRPDPSAVNALDPRSYRTDRILVKFREGFRVRLRDGVLVSPDGLDLAAVRRLLAGRRVEPVFSRPAAELDRERARIAARQRALAPADGGAAPPVPRPVDLANWYRVATKNRSDARALMRALLADPAVETVEGEFRLEAILPACHDDSPSGIRYRGGQQPKRLRTPFFEPNQLYLMHAPGGLGYIDALGVLGVRGDPALRVVHLEAAWILGHEDIPKLTARNVLGSSNFGALDIKTWRQHGTAIAGLLTAATDRKGVRGMVPDAGFQVASFINGYANFISLAMKSGRPGDVFTCSAVFAVYAGGKGYHAPFDYPQITYDAFFNAVLAGFPVTLAAGNSGVDLGTKAIYGTRYLPSSPQSGALLCGATFGPDRVRAPWSNYGEHVHFNGWGALVTTTAYGDLFSGGDEKSTYTWRFGGTSAAAPQVAGVLASLQAVSLIHTGKTIPPKKLVETVEKTGTKIQGKIGVRPNLFAALRKLGLYRGLRVLNEPRPGEAMVVELEVPKGTPFILHMALARSDTQVGYGFPLILHPASNTFLAGGLAASDRMRFDLAIPKDARFSGMKIFFQAAVPDAKLGARLSNGAVGRIQ